MKMIFQFGNFPELSRAELVARVPTLVGGKTVANRFYIIESAESPAWLMQNLGGSVKIYSIVDIEPSADAIARHITDRLQEKNKIIFGISSPHSEKFKKIGLAVKRELQKTGRPVRLVTSRTAEFSAVTTHMEKLFPPHGIEIFLLKEGEKTLVAETVAYQPFEEFSTRDYGRPGRNAHRGMLPPKLAKIMINLALGTADPSEITLYDPFCGSGTILQEAALFGINKIFGSDQAKEAVEDAKNAIAWACENIGISAMPIEIFRHDATKPLAHIKPQSIDIVVTETFLGTPLRHNQTMKPSEKTSLVALYKKSLITVYPLMRVGGRVVMAIPFQPHPRECLPLEKIISNSGFTLNTAGGSTQILEYARQNQRTGRQIICLIKK